MGVLLPCTVSPGKQSGHCCSTRCIVGLLLEDCLYRFRHFGVYTCLAPVELCLLAGVNVARGAGFTLPAGAERFVSRTRGSVRTEARPYPKR